MEPPTILDSLESESVTPVGSRLRARALFLTRNARRRSILRAWVVLKI